MTTIPEEMQQLRNQVMLRLEEAEGQEEQEKDLADALGLVAAPSESKPRKSPKKKVATNLPKVIEVVLRKEGFPDWKFRVLTEKWARLAPAMEVSVENMQALFARIRVDLEVGLPKRRPYGHDKPVRAPPNGEAGRRRYWAGSHWLEKRPAAAPVEDEKPSQGSSSAATGQVAGHRGKRPRCRTLRVQASDLESPARRRRGGGRKADAIRDKSEAPEVPKPPEELVDDFM